MMILPIFLPRSTPCACDCHTGMPNGVATAFAALLCALVYGGAWFVADDVTRAADHEAKMTISDARGWAWGEKLLSDSYDRELRNDELAIFRIERVKP